MFYYDEKKYTCIPFSDDDVSEIERDLSIKLLFGGAFASKVYDIDNAFSDNDFYLVFKGDLSNKRIFDANRLNDYILLDYSKISKHRNYNLDEYPTILYRKDAHKERTNYHMSDFQTTQKLFEILYSDLIWDSGYLKENLETIVDTIYSLDVIDYYFSRAYGNYTNYLVKSETDAIRVLRSFLNIACLRWVIEYRTIPNMRIRNMIALFAPTEIAEYLVKVLNKVKSVNGDVSAQMHIYDVGTDDLFAISDEILVGSNTLVEKGKSIVSVENRFRNYVYDQIGIINAYVKENKWELIGRKIEKGDSAFLFKEENTI